MAEHDPLIPLIDQPLGISVADGEVVLTTQHDAASMTAAAARETGERLIQAADELTRT